jgi:hypothetical protein
MSHLYTPPSHPLRDENPFAEAQLRNNVPGPVSTDDLPPDTLPAAREEPNGQRVSRKA